MRKSLSKQEMTRRMPAYALRLLWPAEEVRYLTRPRLFPLGMAVFIAAVAIAVGAFSAVIRDPGFLRLLSIPALPVIGGLAGHFMHSPVVVVTNRRMISAARFGKPLILDLEKLAALRIIQNPIERRLGYGSLLLMVQPPQNLGEGVFLRFILKKLPDVASLNSAVLAAVDAFQNLNRDL